MSPELLLLTPGPVQVPVEVLAAGAHPMTHHNAPEMQVLIDEVLQGLRPVFGNDGPILIQNSSGRGAMEASLTNLFNPGDAVAVIINGRFGTRFANIARDMGLVVHPVCPEWGRTASETEVAEVLGRHREIKGLIGAMCETGHGTLNDPAMIGAMGARFGVITVIDAVSTAAGMPIRMQEHKIDVCFSGIQKCLMCPPGLAIIATSRSTWDAIVKCRHYRHYFNWVKMRDWIEAPRKEMMGTPPESLLRSLARALSLIHREGLSSVYARHARLKTATCAFASEVGCELLAKDPEFRSNTISGLALPPGIAAPEVVRRVFANDNVLLAAGQDRFKDSAIRIGHMGPVKPDMLLRGVQALARAMTELGLDRRLAKRGVEACAMSLDGAPAPAALPAG